MIYKLNCLLDQLLAINKNNLRVVSLCKISLAGWYSPLGQLQSMSTKITSSTVHSHLQLTLIKGNENAFSKSNSYFD